MAYVGIGQKFGMRRISDDLPPERCHAVAFVVFVIYSQIAIGWFSGEESRHEGLRRGRGPHTMF